MLGFMCQPNQPDDCVINDSLGCATLVAPAELIINSSGVCLLKVSFVFYTKKPLAG